MKHLLKNSRGFTLVELMIVIVIVGILAAVAIPIYRANVKRAKASEAEAALGTIRTACRVFYSEYNRYPIKTTSELLTTAVADSIDVTSEDLTGKYYSSSAYYYVSTADGDSFHVKADVSDNDLDRYIESDGTIHKNLTGYGTF